MNQKFLDAAWELVRRYQHLPLFGVEVVAPYAMNYVGLGVRDFLKEHNVTEDVQKAFGTSLHSGELGFGNFLGKGSPDELVRAASALLVNDIPPTAQVTPDGIRSLMQLYGVGIDCSGFVFHVLSAAWETTGSTQGFLQQLTWGDPEKQTVRRANAAAFAVGEPRTGWDDLEPFDLLLLQSPEGEINHVALILPGNNGSWWVVQSARSTNPAGVTTTELSIDNNQPHFAMPLGAGTPWEKLVEMGRVKRHRLTTPV